MFKKLVFEKHGPPLSSSASFCSLENQPSGQGVNSNAIPATHRNREHLQTSLSLEIVLAITKPRKAVVPSSAGLRGRLWRLLSTARHLPGRPTGMPNPGSLSLVPDALDLRYTCSIFLVVGVFLESTPGTYRYSVLFHQLYLGCPRTFNSSSPLLGLHVLAFKHLYLLALCDFHVCFFYPPVN